MKLNLKKMKWNKLDNSKRQSRYKDKRAATNRGFAKKRVQC